MRTAQNSMADRNQGDLPVFCDRPMILSILTETGISDCFSIEWLLDRFEQRRTPA
ncbi:hypothetical protein TG4357_03585 [Thalassovita gelatinovora]|uniref:Uncharacterized protein n=1 Tax=Thalassovita gelatinovora TaxID=53501 RepID=A0A0P1FKG6_THAGE|nr:hypothetical protein [Thalassovita gelatinovora]QIZ82372.1 hypothetical protein HFZ77_18765 [Thalassovita gelatinovora]CUH68443.1 hypothetical protein TG4357_03585 [Thalassovita gelatinovora]SEQ52262.1 hypothetical protein SAMN04488043_10646 [Thalassovita gelatinovora]